MRRAGVTLLLCTLLAGCGIFSRSKSRIYSLDRIKPATPIASVRGTPLGIDAIELPPGLDRKEVVVRQADLRLEVRGTEQWSAPLEPLVLHTLAFDLADRMPEGMVILPGQPKPLGAMRSVSVVFEDLAASADRSFVLDARWNVNQTGTPVMTHHERIVIPMQSLESAAVATAMSQALAQLADRMAAGL